MRIRYVMPVVAGIVLSMPAGSQSLTPVPFSIREYLVEAVASGDLRPADYETLLEELDRMQLHPLNLNEAGEEELRQLPFLTDFQIRSLLDYRQEHGALLSVNELALVHGFTDEVLARVQPFVTVSGDRNSLKRQSGLSPAASRHEFTARTQRILEKPRGYQEDEQTSQKRYPGNPWLYYVRYGYSRGNKLQAGLTLEKDPGEDFFRGSNPKGFDFFSAYIRVTDLGPMKTIVAGDYRLGFGQGLTLWNGAAPGKSSLPLQVMKRTTAIKPFTSTDENDFFRGIAASSGWRKLTITAFYSEKKRDANITDTLPTGHIHFSSLQESGYHRTRSEIQDEKSVRQATLGGNITLRGNWFRIGATLVQHRFDKYWEAGDALKDLYDFRGNKLLNGGVDYVATVKNIQLFGETSYGNQHWATLNGIQSVVNKYISLILVYRNYSRGYYSLHANAFSEGSAGTNEEAVYAGLVLHPVRKLKVSAYADFYRFPWLRYGLNAPSSGSDYLLQTDYTVCKNLDMYCRIKYELDPEDLTTDSLMIPVFNPVHRLGIRYHVRFFPASSLSLQSRLELVKVKPLSGETSRGFLIYQDVEYRLEKLPLILDFRIAWFNTRDYSARVYAYEQDLTAGYSFSPLYWQGYRTYLMFRYDVSPSLSCRLRLSQTGYFHHDTIGSGYDEIDANTRSEIKIQLTATL
jgi:hypothetical protein